MSTNVITLNTSLENFRVKFEDNFLNKFNCKFLGKNINRVYDSLCIGTVIPLFKIIITFAIISGSMFFASLFSNILAIRYARNIRKDTRIHDEKIQNQTKPNKF